MKLREVYIPSRKLIFGQPTIDHVSCSWSGTMSYKRYVGICSTVHYPDIGAELIRRGMALDCTRYSHGRYLKLEPPEARKKIMGKSYCE